MPRRYLVQQSASEEKVLLCVGLGYGRLLRIGDVYGSEVNAASKLGEDTAKAWEILVTGSMRDTCSDTGGIGFEPLPEAPAGADRAYRVSYSIDPASKRR